MLQHTHTCARNEMCQKTAALVTARKKDRIIFSYYIMIRVKWQRGLRRGSAASRLLGMRVRIPPAACMSVSCECCVSSSRGLCVRLITRPEES